MGDLGTLLDLTFVFAAVLLIGSMSGYLSEKVGVINIGIDGMMCIGALMFGIYSAPLLKISSLGWWSIFIPLILSMLTTMIMGALHGFACITLKANHIVSGTAINLLGLALATFLNQPIANLLSDGTATKLVSGYGQILPVAASLYGSSIIIFIAAILIAVILYVVMHQTKVGLRFRAVGENPNAVDSQGINVYKYQWAGVMLSSAFAGLAGALFLFKINTFAGNDQSLGYLALAILIAGAWKLPWMVVFTIVFALFTACANTSTLTALNVPQEVTFAIPYIVTIVILCFSSKNVSPPANSGIPFEKSMR